MEIKDEKEIKSTLIFISLILISIIIIIYFPYITHIAGIDLDDYIDPKLNPIQYMFAKYHAWMVLIIIMYGIFVIADNSRGLLKSGMEEWREWRRTKL